MIRKRGTSTWEISWYERPDPVTGKRPRRYMTYHGTRRGAETAERDALTKRDLGIAVIPSKLTVAELFTMWLEEYAKPRVRPHTFRRYRSILAGWSELLGSARVQDLRVGHIRGALSALQNPRPALPGRKQQRRPLGARTQGHYMRLLRDVFDYAVESQYLHQNPAASSVLDPAPAPRKAMQIVRPEQLPQLLADFEQDDQDVILFSVATGLRRGETLGLAWDAVDLDGGSLRVERALYYTKEHGHWYGPPKSEESRRTVALGAPTVALLREHRTRQLERRLKLGKEWQEHGLVFPDPDGSPQIPERLTARFTRIARRAGFPGLRLHDLRHSSATLALLADTDIKTVSARLGHSRASFTMDTYVRPLAELDRKAADKLDALLRRRDPQAEEA